MRKIIDYIRSCFCKHEWELIIDNYTYPSLRQDMTKVYRCTKCGYYKKYKEW